MAPWIILVRFCFPFVVLRWLHPFWDILPDADLDAAVDGIHLPGIKRSEILPALALIYRRDLLQKDNAPGPQEHRRRHSRVSLAGT